VKKTQSKTKAQRDRKSKRDVHEHKTGNLHIDKRAAQLLAIAEGGDDDLLLTTDDVMAWLQVSRSFLEIGRGRGYGPEFIMVSPGVIRYRRGAVKQWLAQREYKSIGVLTPAAREAAAA
jgi:hypothetical protein